MGEAAGELAHGFHLLALAQLVLELLALGDVAADAVDHSVLGHDAPGDPLVAAIGPAHADVEIVDRLATQQPLEGRAGVGHVLGMDHAVVAPADDLILAVAQQLAPGRVARAIDAVGRDRHEQIAGAVPDPVALAGALLDARLQRLGELAQHGLGLLGGGDVVDHPHEAGAVTRLVGQVLAPAGDPAFLAGVRAPDPQLAIAAGVVGWSGDADQQRIAWLHHRIDRPHRQGVGRMQAQQAAELFRHAGRAEPVDMLEGAHAAGGLGHPQLLLDTLLLGDVRQHAGEAHQGPGGVLLAQAPPADPADHAVRPAHPEFLGEDLRAAQHARHGDADPEPVLFVDAAEEGVGGRARGDGGGVQAGQAGEPRVGEQAPCPRVPDPGAGGLSEAGEKIVRLRFAHGRAQAPAAAPSSPTTRAMKSRIRPRRASRDGRSISMAM